MKDKSSFKVGDKIVGFDQVYRTLICSIPVNNIGKARRQIKEALERGIKSGKDKKT